MQKRSARMNDLIGLSLIESALRKRTLKATEHDPLCEIAEKGLTHFVRLRKTSLCIIGQAMPD